MKIQEQQRQEWLNEPHPSVLYLYLHDPLKSGENPTDLLENRRLKLSRVGRLNDPFDMVPGFAGNIAPAVFREYLERGRFRGIYYDEVTPKRVADLKATYEKMARDPQSEWLHVAEDSRLICMSSRRDGILLWSHYADSHRGFAVGFKTETLFHDTPRIAFGKVTYEPERYKFSPLDFLEDQTQTSAIGGLIYRKSPEWKYEQEWRAIVPTSQRTDDDFLPFPADAIESIILGSRMEIEGEEKIRAACEVGGIRADLPIFRGELSKEKFEILIQPSRFR